MTQDRTQIPDTNQPVPKQPNDNPQREPNPHEKPEIDLPNKNSETPYDKDDIKGEKATQFDGNPNPKGTPENTFKPQDDTPTILDKKQGPNT